MLVEPASRGRPLPGTGSGRLNRAFEFLCETRLEIDSNDASLHSRARNFLAKTFAFSGGPVPKDGPALRLHLRYESPPGVSRGSVKVYSSEGLNVWKTGPGFRLQTDGSAMELSTSSMEAMAYLQPGVWSSDPRALREFFLIGVLMLLHERGMYGLHAVGLDLERRGLLLLGDSGAGKTTTALALIRCGWSYLSDDALCLNGPAEDGAVTAHAFRRGFSTTADGWRALGSPGSAAEEGWQIETSKWLVDMNRTNGSQHTGKTLPAAVCFPSVTTDRETRAVKLAPSDGLSRMIPQAAGIRSDPIQSRRILDTLGALAGQVNFYELRTGRDVFDDPRRLSGLLSDMVCARHG